MYRRCKYVVCCNHKLTIIKILGWNMNNNFKRIIVPKIEYYVLLI